MPVIIGPTPIAYDSGSSSGGTTDSGGAGGSGSAQSGEQINRKMLYIQLNESISNGTLKLAGNVKANNGGFSPSFFTFQAIIDTQSGQEITNNFIISQSPASTKTYISPASDGTPITFTIKTKGTATIPSKFKMRICLIRQPGYGCTVTINKADFFPN